MARKHPPTVPLVLTLTPALADQLASVHRTWAHAMPGVRVSPRVTGRLLIASAPRGAPAPTPALGHPLEVRLARELVLSFGDERDWESMALGRLVRALSREQTLDPPTPWPELRPPRTRGTRRPIGSPKAA